MLDEHGVVPAEANEALADTNVRIFNPDYASKTGKQARTIGYSVTRDELLSVFTVTEDGITYGINAWKSNAKDRRYYYERE